MTPQHRRRLSIAAAVTLVILAFLTTPVFVSQGVAVGLGVMALSAIAPLIVLALVAYVWSSNDREAAKLTGNRPMQR